MARQAACSGLAGASAWIAAGPLAAVSSGCGGAVAMINLLMLSRRLDSTACRHSSAPLYLGAVERFLFTACAFVIALGHLRLPAMPLLAGFACAQVGHRTGLKP